MSKRTARKQAAGKATGTIKKLKQPDSTGIAVNFYGMCGWLASAACMLMPNRDLYSDPAVCEHCSHDHSGEMAGHVMTHKTRLAMATTAVDRLATTWLPDEVVVINNQEVCLWDLDGLDVDVTTDQAPRPTKTVSQDPPPGFAPGLDTPGKILSMAAVHPESSLRRDWDRVAGCARVWLVGGTLTGMFPQLFENANRGGKSNTIATYLSWKPKDGARVTFMSCGKGIVLSPAAMLFGAQISITNSANAPGQHFSVLYSLLKSYNPPMISPTQTHDETYPAETCKPPAGVPEP